MNLLNHLQTDSTPTWVVDFINNWDDRTYFEALSFSNVDLWVHRAALLDKLNLRYLGITQVNTRIATRIRVQLTERGLITDEEFTARVRSAGNRPNSREIKMDSSAIPPRKYICKTCREEWHGFRVGTTPPLCETAKQNKTPECKWEQVLY